MGVSLLIMSRNNSEPNGSRKPIRFILVDRTGPLAEFETWEDAFRYMAANPEHGGSLVRSEEPMGKRPRPKDCMDDDRESDVRRDGASARGQAGRPALGFAAGSQLLLPAPGPAATRATKKVLVIAEDVLTLLAMAQMVKGAGHGVVIARDAAEGVEAVRLEKPDLILVDINLTARASDLGWDGFQVLEWLNCHYPHPRAKYIIVSSGDPEKLLPRAAAVGAFGFLGKPIAKEMLLNEIIRAIGSQPESARADAPGPRPG